MLTLLRETVLVGAVALVVAILMAILMAKMGDFEGEWICWQLELGLRMEPNGEGEPKKNLRKEHDAASTVEEGKVSGLMVAGPAYHCMLCS